MTRTTLFYAIGKSETELYAYDEDDSRGDGVYFTDDNRLYERYSNLDKALETAKERGLNVYLVEIRMNDSPELDTGTPGPSYTTTVSLQWEYGGGQ